MPHVSMIVNHGKEIVRFRCYGCAEPWWELTQELKYEFETVKVPEGKCHTIVMLCDHCLEKFYKEGRFWIPKEENHG